MGSMETIRSVLLLVIMGPIALAIGGGVIADTMPDFYNTLASLDANVNVSDLFVLVMQYAPIGLGLAILMSMFSLAGFNLFKDS